MLAGGALDYQRGVRTNEGAEWGERRRGCNRSRSWVASWSPHAISKSAEAVQQVVW
jgi:hypothetical protein